LNIQILEIIKEEKTQWRYQLNVRGRQNKKLHAASAKKKTTTKSRKEKGD
jgi:hypothetical protein